MDQYSGALRGEGDFLARPEKVLNRRMRGRLSEIFGRISDMRQLRWPDTANPHLFLTNHTGRRTEECSKRWIWLTIGPPDLSGNDQS